MIVSSITQTKAEAQKLIKLYNKLQAEAKTANTAEAARKVAEAEKLVSQINILQSTISKIKAKDREINAKKNIEQHHGQEALKMTENKIEEIKSNEEDDYDRTELEDRIKRIEQAQKQTRAQIEQLNQAKAELSRLRSETEKNTTQIVNLGQNSNDAKLSLELEKVRERLNTREIEYQGLKKEMEIVRRQAQKDADFLKEQRNTALEKQKQLEKEKMVLLRRTDGKRILLKGLLIGILLSLLCGIALLMLISMTPQLDNMICRLKGYPTSCLVKPSTENTAKRFHSRTKND